MNNNLPSFTIVTPTFNSEKYIRKTIESVLSQTYRNFEYFVIDGDSTDSTNKIIKSFGSDIDYTISERDEGMYSALNKGFNKGKGDIFCYINSDDILLPNTLAIVAEFFYFNKKFDLLYGDMNLIDHKGNYKYTHCYRNFSRNEFICHISSLIGQSSAFWRREIFFESNQFDTKFKLASDYDFFAKLIIKKKVKFKYIPIPLSSFRIHQDTLSYNFHSTNINEINKIRKKYKYTISELIISKIFNNYHKFKMLQRYSFARIVNFLRIRPLIPFWIINFFQLIYLNLISCLKYIYISKKAKIHFNKNSNIKISKGVKIMDNVKIYLNENSNLFIGENTIIRKNCEIVVNSSVFIGRDTLLEEGVKLIHSHKSNREFFLNKRMKNIYIKNNSILKSSS